MREGMKDINEPTTEQCRNNTIWTDEDGFRYLTFYWPQMGGYSAKALARISTEEDEGCVMVWVWHDGEFPFTESEREFENKPKSPAVLHICDFEDWLQAIERLAKFQSGEGVS